MVRLLELAIGSLILSASAVAAAPGPVSREFPANNVQTRASWDTYRCTDGDGNTLTVINDCTDEYCGEPVNKFVERRNADGELLGPRILINPEPAEAWSDSIYCNRGGDFVVQYDSDPDDDVCLVVRPFSRDGRARSMPVSIASPKPCNVVTQSAISLYEDGGFAAAWTESADMQDKNGLRARRFASDATPLADAVTLNAATPGWTSWPSLAIDESEYALVGWSSGPDEETLVMARVLDPGGAPYGEAFAVTPQSPSWTTASYIVAEGGALFTVMWEDYNHGGQVGRRVALDTDAAPATTTTTLPPPPDDFPAFGPARILASRTTDHGSWWRPEVYGGGEAAWYVSVENNLYGTQQDGRRWHAAVEFEPYPSLHRALVTDGRGTWLGLHEHYNEAAVYLDRSQDDGHTWSDPQPLASWDHLSNECDDCNIRSMDLEMGSDGTIIAAWSFSDYEEWSETHYESMEHIYTALSDDGGVTWSAPALVSDAGTGELEAFDLETDDRGTWILMWVNPWEELGAPKEVLESRSTDGGRTWSAPTVVAQGLPNWGSWGDQRLQLAAGSSGEWVAVFGGPELDFDLDSDVYSMRSTDGGWTWEQPIPINVYAANDGATDSEPSIATDGTGRWLAVWGSYYPLGGVVGLDAEILASMSTDAGATWSTPVAVDSGAASEVWRDDAPRVIADERGVWLVAWHSRPPFQMYGDVVDRAMVAVAGDHCRDGVLDAGEECDDGDEIEGDGCDTNCTTTACGNGIATAGEPCDDGNESNQDACLAGCIVARCGDGFVYAGAEECDDANSSDNDDCLSTCRLAACGDGFTRTNVEECDDANPSNEDECTTNCTRAACGDGYVRAGVEECDDGNAVSYDSCLAGCRAAACGDGWINIGFEQCDPGLESEKDFCTQECTITDLCGDADGDGLTLASDARRILLTAVGRDQICPARACDIDGRFGITATDARVGLKIAVGDDGGDKCPLQRSVVFSLLDARRFGALQLEVDYSSGGGAFSDRGAKVHCETLVPQTIASYSDIATAKLLSMGLVSINGFQGPIDFARCLYRPDEGVGLSMQIRTVDAADIDLTPIHDPAAITYRIE